MNVKKMAAKDAAEFARAKMFYGDGAGTRRKLIKEAVEYKIRVVPGYAIAYESALASQDMAKHASKATSERGRRDAGKFITRNIRGVVKGDRRSMTTSVAVVVVVGTWAHQTGVDKKAYEYSKKKARQARDKVEVMRFRRKVDKVHNITSLRDD